MRTEYIQTLNHVQSAATEVDEVQRSFKRKVAWPWKCKDPELKFIAENSLQKLKAIRCSVNIKIVKCAFGLFPKQQDEINRRQKFYPKVSRTRNEIQKSVEFQK